MKIDFITSLNDANDIRIRKKFIESILELGNEVKYFCVDSKFELITHKSLSYEFHKKPKSKFSRLNNNIKLFFEVSKRKQDIIQISNPELLPVAFLKLFKRKTKFIFDMHEDFEGTIKDKSSNKTIGVIGSQIYKFFLSFLMKYFLDYVYVTTPLIKEKFKSEKVILIENYALKSHIHLDDTKDLKMTQINPNSLNIIFTGLISEVRGITNILEVIKKNPELDVMLYLVGAIDGSYLNKLTKDYQGHFLYIPSVPYKEMLMITKSMDVGIIPYLPIRNHLVTRPNKLFEYMMCSIPVMGCDYPLYSEVINQGIGETFDVTSDESVRKVIQDFIEYKQQNKLVAMGSKGFQLYMKHYNWESEFEKIKGIYRRNDFESSNA